MAQLNDRIIRGLRRRLSSKMIATAFFFNCLTAFSNPYFSDTMKWKDETGSGVQLSQWKGKRIFLTMSYTECKKTCPLVTIKTLKEIQAQLKEKKQEAEFVVVSFDPKNDTPEELMRYKKRMHLTLSNWHFLVGSESDTEKLAQLLGLPFWKYDDHIIHKFKIQVIEPDGNMGQSLDWDHRQYLCH